jgi:hypothetical protein
MPKCLEFSHTDTSGAQSLDVFYSSELDLVNCASFANSDVVMSPTEYEALLNNASETFLTHLFNPSFITTDQYQMLFMLGLTTPLFGYIVAWGYQTVISFMAKN